MPVRLASRHKYRAKEPSELGTTASPDAIAARFDLAKFGEYVCGKVAEEIHQSWFPILVTGQSNDCLNLCAGEDTNLLSFRGSGKTTWMRIAIAWLFGHNPHMQLGWVSYSEQIAVKSSRVIKRIIESPRYREVFPEVRPGKRWGDLDWEIDKGFASVSVIEADFSFQAIGITGSITSNRFHLLVYDDLIKSKKAIANEEVRASMLETIQDAIEPCLIPGGRALGMGTRWRNDDIHAKYFIPENDWVIIEQPAIVLGSDGKERSAWESRFSLEFLWKIRSRKPLTFIYQYQNQLPALNEEAPIKPEFIQYGDLPAVLRSLTLGIDLAAGENETDDFTALVLSARDEVGNYWIVATHEFRASGNLAKIKQIMEFRKTWGNFRVIVEKNAYQKSFEGDFRDYCKRYRVQNLVVDTVSAVDDKIMRLESVSGIFENGFVFFNKLQGMQRLISQLLGMDGEHDDLMDACVYALNPQQKRARRRAAGAG
jgi:predicted phage terminase large subunit-like protein